MLKSLPLALALTLAVCAPAATQPRQPKLLVVITVDQFSSDLFREYRPHFTRGLKRLSEGVVFANGYQAHAATETCPGHATIVTGTHPARNGMIANGWVNFDAPREDKEVNCAEDERIPGTTSSAYTVSHYHLKVPTLGDRLKQADSSSRIVAVAGKDRSAMLLGGRAADQAWFWKGDRFVPIGSPAALPVTAQVNAAIAQSIGRARPALTPTPYCAAKERAIDVGGGRSVGTHRFQRAAGDADAFRVSPEVDAATLAMAAALARQMQLGRSRTDVLAIGLAGTDFIGHRYGSAGMEMCLQLMSLDADLGGFFALLDRWGIDYAVALTSDHGVLDLPERQRLQGVADAARMDAALLAENVGATIARQLGLAGPVFIGDWYLTPSVPASRRNEVLALARDILARHKQVHSVFTKAEVAAHPMPATRPEQWTLLDRFRASFDPVRSGDLHVALKPNITPIPVPGRSVATHGSPWDYDRKVPILFWWKGAAAQDRPESAMTVDILPTLAPMAGLPLAPGEVDGRCLDLGNSACPAR